jgi:ankyrin repeat protein
VTDALTPDELAFVQGLFDHAREGRTAELVQALDAGVPVNLTNSVGDTLLILAAYHQHRETVDALLARGADTERVNDRGQTALGGAVFRQDEPVVRALLAAGADPDGGGRTARELAAFFELPAMAALLDAPR